MTKPLHVGRAAQSAIFAVELVQRGFTASVEAIEGDVGYWAVLGRDARYRPDELAATLGNPFQVVTPGVNVKAYPCCASTHAAIDIALEVADGLSEAEIERVVVEVPYTAPLILIHHRPDDPLSAKFSLEYCVAAALLDGAVTLESFTEQAVRRPDLQALLRRVEFVVPPEWQTSDGTSKTGFARINVYLGDGTLRRAATDVVLGSPARPLTDTQHEAKFLSCARLALGDEQALAALAMIREFEHLGQIGPLAQQLAISQ
jgi:2-methylcitrate dehydratase PrpD